MEAEPTNIRDRQLRVCDSFDAMTSDRPYRRALSETDTLAELEREAGKQFDPQAAESFLDLARAGTPLERERERESTFPPRVRSGDC